MPEFDLPYPPSVNRAWRAVGGRVLISREGRLYRERVRAALAGGGDPLEGRLALCLDAAPPDRRRRDLDNVQKSLIDALEAGRAFKDDEQIDLIVSRRRPVAPGGKVHVRLDPLPLERCPLCGSPRRADDDRFA